jgi:hypothetical protein
MRGSRSDTLVLVLFWVACTVVSHREANEDSNFGSQFRVFVPSELLNRNDEIKHAIRCIGPSLSFEFMQCRRVPGPRISLRNYFQIHEKGIILFVLLCPHQNSGAPNLTLTSTAAQSPGNGAASAANPSVPVTSA